MGNKLIISISLSDYLIDRTGTPKVVLSHQIAANDKGIKYVSIFPVGEHSGLMRCLLADSFGVVVDGSFVGVKTVGEFLRMIRAYEKSGFTVGAFHVHHLMRWNFDTIWLLFKALPSLPIVYFVHDYYLCCINYNLLNGGIPCGAKALGAKECERCECYNESSEIEQGIWKLIRSASSRATYICPSRIVQEIFLGFHPRLSDRCFVSPHQKMIGHYSGNLSQLDEGQNVKVAFLGNQQDVKGWRQWGRLVERTKGKYDFIVCNKDESTLPEAMRRVHVEFTPDCQNAMIEALRREKIDVAVLWSTCPETYSFTCMEAYAANAFIVTNSGSGNIADFVKTNAAGLVLENERELLDLFSSPNQVRLKINRFRLAYKGGPCELACNDELLMANNYFATIAVEGKDVFASKSESCRRLIRSLYSKRETGKIKSLNSGKKKNANV